MNKVKRESNNKNKTMVKKGSNANGFIKTRRITMNDKLSLL
jgi:hypothetical protein